MVAEDFELARIVPAAHDTTRPLGLKDTEVGFKVALSGDEIEALVLLKMLVFGATLVVNHGEDSFLLGSRSIHLWVSLEVDVTVLHVHALARNEHLGVLGDEPAHVLIQRRQRLRGLRVEHRAGE